MEEIKSKYERLYPHIKWDIISGEKKSYCPASDTLYFEIGNISPRRFISVEKSTGSMFGDFALHIYLYPLINCYGSPTPDGNPTIRKYFEAYPTEREILNMVRDQVPTYFN